MRLLIFTSLFLLLPALLNAQTALTDLQSYYSSVLTELSIVPELDEEGDLAFTVGDRSFYLALQEEDSTYIQITRWGVLNVNNVSEAIDILTIGNEINREQKVVKLFLSDDMVMISAELFTDGQRNHKELIRRSIEAIIATENIFLSKLR